MAQGSKKNSPSSFNLPPTDGKQEALKRALEQIEKRFGAGSIQRLDDTTIRRIPAISTGASSLDIALGVAQRSFNLDAQRPRSLPDEHIEKGRNTV